MDKCPFNTEKRTQQKAYPDVILNNNKLSFYIKVIGDTDNNKVQVLTIKFEDSVTSDDINYIFLILKINPILRFLFTKFYTDGKKVTTEDIEYLRQKMYLHTYLLSNIFTIEGETPYQYLDKTNLNKFLDYSINLKNLLFALVAEMYNNVSHKTIYNNLSYQETYTIIESLKTFNNFKEKLLNLINFCLMQWGNTAISDLTGGQATFILEEIISAYDFYHTFYRGGKYIQNAPDTFTDITNTLYKIDYSKLIKGGGEGENNLETFIETLVGAHSHIGDVSFSLTICPVREDEVIDM